SHQIIVEINVNRWFTQVKIVLIEPLALFRIAFDCGAELSWQRGVTRSGLRLGFAIEGSKEIFCFFTPLPP
ncbi:MAG: hypothetical protein AAB217_08140, partial [Chloroflexota bacterium]